MSTDEIFYGDHFANSYNGAGTGLTAIPRSALAAAAPNTVVVNDGAGLLSAAAQLSPAQGGTGADTSASTGVAKVAAGIWSVSAVVNADVAAGAAIARSKLASGSANYVVINSGAGVLTEEQFLAVSRGGTGQDLSGVGVGPFVLTNSSGTIASTLQYTSAATPSTLVSRDVSGNFAGNVGTFTNLITPTISAVGDLTISPAGGDIFLGTNLVHMTPTSIPGGDTMWYAGNIQTVGAVTSTIISVPTVSKTAYQFDVLFAAGDTATTAAAGFSFKVRAKNTGAVSVGAILQKTTSADAAINTANVTASLSGANVVFQVVGVVGKTINWVARVGVVAQTY